MIELVLRLAGLVAIYLLVLTSSAPGDILTGILLAAGLLAATGVRDVLRSSRRWDRWLVAFVRMVVTTGWEMAIGTVRVVRFCLLGDGSPGFVEIPRDDRSRHAVALWGVLTGEAPDEYPVATDDERHLLIVHLTDASDPEAVRRRHAIARDRHLREVVR